MSSVSVEAVLDGKVSLPCDIDPGDKLSDRVNMVLWFRDSSGKPIYTFDVRGRPYKEAQMWSDPAWLGPRAHFSTAHAVEGTKTPRLPNVPHRTAELSIDRVQLSDEAVYRCRVDFKSSRSKNYQVNLTVIVPPTTLIMYDASGRDVTGGVVGPLVDGSDLILKCEVRGGRPPPTLTWFANNRVVEGFVERPEDNVLVSRLQEHAMMRRHLNNTYRCQASNTKLRDPTQHSVRLEMILDPLMTRIVAKPDHLVADHEATMTCESKGSRPQAVISWWRARGHDGTKTLFRRGRVENTSTEELVRSTLTFVPQPSDDGAVILCMAINPELRTDKKFNDDRKMTDNMTLNVVYPPIVSLKLGASLNPDDIKQGDDVYFECDIQANPRNRGIWWFHNGTPVTHNVSAGVVLSTQSLVMQGVTRAHAGHYVCRAANEQGETASQPVRLRVKYAPVCRTASTVIVGASLDETVRVHCAVDADPRDVRFTWRLTNSADTFEVSPQKTGPHNATTSELRYQPESDKDYGTLTCWGRNSVGGQTDPCVFHVIPAMRPGPVHNCTLRSAPVSNGSSLQLLAPVPPGQGTGNALGNALGEAPAPGSGVVDVECMSGPDGGLQQTFHLEAYESRTMRLRHNASATEPAFRLDPGQLLPARTHTLHLVLYASNAKGRSQPLTMDGIALRDRARHVEYMGDGEGLSQPLLYTLVVTASLLLLAGLLVLCLAYRRRRQRHPAAASVAKASRHGNQLDIKQDQCYVVSYTLKSAADCASERKPDILETPRGNETNAVLDSLVPSPPTPSSAQRPDSLFGAPSAGSGCFALVPGAALPAPPAPPGGLGSVGPSAAVAPGAFPYPAPSRDAAVSHMSSPGINSPLSGTAPGLSLLAACAPGQGGQGGPALGSSPSYIENVLGNGTLRRTPREPLRDAPPPPPVRDSRTVVSADRSISDSIPGPESCV